MGNEEKEITIYDLARELAISAATVSRGLQGHSTVSKKTRKRINDLAILKGYRSNHFASNLRRQRTHTIGVIVPRLNSNFMSAVISGMENVATKAGFNLIISQSSENVTKEKANAITMFNNRVDGLLVSLAYDADESRHFDIFLQKKIPVIFFDRVPDSEHFTKILIDNRKAAREATSHLLEQGCKRIVHITAISKRNVYADRIQGYKDALSEAGIAFNKDLIVYNNLSYDAGYEAADMIRKLKPIPDGVFVANDNCAVSCMIGLKEAGIRIPHDIAFAGFNNDPVSKVIEPNLTTINYPGHEMGELAMRNLINHLNSDSTTTATNTITMRSELIIRASSQRKN